MAGENNPLDEESARRLAEQLHRLEQQSSRSAEAQEKYAQALESANPLVIKELEARRQMAEIQASGKKAFEGLTYSLKGFDSALTDTTGSFKKYQYGLESLGKASSEVLKNFGALGIATSAVIKGLTFFTGKVLEQTDNIVKAYDDLAKVGGSAGLTSKQIYEFGREAGFTSHTLSQFSKAAVDSSDALVAMGGSVSKGMKQFKDFTAVGEDTVQQYRRLGFTQEELLNAQTAYIKNQQQSGAMLAKSPKELQKASLEYIDSLVKLSDLTGASVKKQQEAADFAAANENWTAYKFAKELEREEARARGDKDTADRIDAELKAKEEFIRGTSNFSTKMRTGLLELISGATPVITETTANMKVAGYNVEKLADNLNKGQSQTAEFYAENARVQKNVSNQLGALGYAYGSATKEAHSAFGTDIEARREAMKQLKASTEEGRKELAEQEKQTKTDIDRKKKEADAAVEAAVQRDAFERRYREAMDRLIDVINPLTSTTGKVIFALAGLAAVAGAVGTALLSLRAIGGFKGVMETIKSGAMSRGSPMNPMHVVMGPGGGGLGGLLGGDKKPPGGLVGEAKTKYDTLRSQGMPASEALKQSRGFGHLSHAETAIKGAPQMTTVPAKTPGGAMGNLGKGTEALGKLGEGNILKSLSSGLRSFANPQILLGATIFGSSVGIIITTIGAGIAAASWLMGKALPTLSEGLKSFQDLDGDKLAGAGKGIAALGGGLAVFSAGGVAANFGAIMGNLSEGLINFFGGKTPIDKVVEFADKTKNVDPDRLKKMGEGLSEFAKAMMLSGLGAVSAGFGAVAGNIAGGIAKLTGGDAVDKFVKFIDKTKDIDPDRAGKMGEAFRKFAEGMGAYGGVRTTGAVAPTVAAPAATAPAATAPAATAPAATAPAATAPAAAPGTPSTAPATAPKPTTTSTAPSTPPTTSTTPAAAPATAPKPTTASTAPATSPTTSATPAPAPTATTPRRGGTASEARAVASKPPASGTSTAGGGRGTVNPPLVQPQETKTAGAGGGRGFINPELVKPEETTTQTASTAGAGRGTINPELVKPEQEPPTVAAATATPTPTEPPKPPEPPTAQAAITPQTAEPVEPKPRSAFSKLASLLGFGSTSTPATETVAKDSGSFEKTGRGEAETVAAAGPTEAKPVKVNDLTDLFTFTGATGSMTSFKELGTELQKNVALAAEEYLTTTGKKLQVNSAKRDPEDQKRLYQETVDAGRPGIGPTGMAVGKPGTSSHEKGEAIDIQQGKTDNLAVDILAKYGLKQNVPNDPVHFAMKPSTEVAQATAKSAKGGSMDEEQIKEMIKTHEGLSLTPYKDTKGLWTVGYGHLIGDGKTLPNQWDKTWTKDAVDGLFELDYRHHRRAAENIPGFDKLDTSGQGGLTDLTFNMGSSWYKKWPQLQAQLKEGNTEAAALNLEGSDWYKQVKSRGPQVVSLIRNAKVSAADEGIASGPLTGYPATLHGDELIKKITKDSILDKLAHTPYTEASKPATESSNQMADILEELKELQSKTYDLMSDKLTSMIDKLQDSVGVQENIYKQSIM